MNVAPPSIAGLLFATLLSVGCDSGPAVSNAPPIKRLPTTQMVLAGQTFELEMAIDSADQQRGMMYRTEMGEREGMIFIFPTAEPRAFYMKNTNIPLDIAYLDDNGIILNIPKLYPRDLTSVPSRGPARYAIELRQGTADRIGLREGDRVHIPESLR